ncbi:Aurovertin biosynthesis cluster transcription factor aurF [Metarhizium brunneum]|uniref:Aurovertin biosynthesis cluster transcription factor aurF n=1 Tax=Metarhizium brunneum TaxID=500148 RepID=A0A7D5YTR2_9HYPO|nr:Aurovertin biosynthesis cluster transcription factor aurF [Metarhizium brunneum]
MILNTKVWWAVSHLDPFTKSLDESQRKTLRARFHNSKRYGKRWMHVLLTEKLGRGILLLCSPKLAKMV